jgi:UDP-2,3-diacylglucosamine pyrophosphatase LpxH
MKYKTIILSDIHLGSAYSRASDATEFLANNQCEKLILNGDIIDGWALKSGSKWTEEHMKLVRKILKISRDTEVIWVKGNHDEFLMDFIGFTLGNISIKSEIEHIGVNGKRYLVIHGDIFDVFITNMKWLAMLGSLGYDLCLWINKHYNTYRRWRGLEYFSLSKVIKDSVKQATKYVGDFESHMVKHAKNLEYDGVICGHIHKAEIRDIDGMEYKNSGDWVESKTALVENHDGSWSVIEV